jgi:hypothetical protein
MVPLTGRSPGFTAGGPAQSAMLAVALLFLAIFAGCGRNATSSTHSVGGRTFGDQVSLLHRPPQPSDVPLSIRPFLQLRQASITRARSVPVTRQDAAVVAPAANGRLCVFLVFGSRDRDRTAASCRPRELLNRSTIWVARPTAGGFRTVVVASDSVTGVRCGGRVIHPKMNVGFCQMAGELRVPTVVAAVDSSKH